MYFIDETFGDERVGELTQEEKQLKYMIY